MCGALASDGAHGVAERCQWCVPSLRRIARCDCGRPCVRPGDVPCECQPRGGRAPGPAGSPATPQHGGQHRTRGAKISACPQFGFSVAIHTVYLLGDSTLLGLHQHQRPAPLGRFSEFQVGLDHVAFGCASRGELEKWSRRLDELGIEHGGIKDAPYGSGLSFRDPDGIALELFPPPTAA